MRLSERHLKTVYLKKRVTTQDNEANDIISYGDAVELRMTVQSAGGSVMAAVYGERLPYVKSCKYQGNLIREGKNEKDGICLYVDANSEPDYEIKSIHPYDQHTNIVIEKRDV